MMFPDRLKMLRKEKGLTQIEFAKAFNISNGTIAMWETNKREPDFDTTQCIADFFSVSVDYLLGRTDDPSPPNKTPPAEAEGESKERASIIAWYREYSKNRSIDQLERDKEILLALAGLEEKKKREESQ